MLKRIITLGLLLTWRLCSADVYVHSAASLTDAMDEIAHKYENERE